MQSSTQEMSNRTNSFD